MLKKPYFYILASKTNEGAVTLAHLLEKTYPGYPIKLDTRPETDLSIELFIGERP